VRKQANNSVNVEAACRDLIHAFRSQQTLRAGSLITTVFGDAIAPRGGKVWLGSLIRVMEGFGVNERLVRTSVFRLVQDGWLESEQIGRRSYYRLTDEGAERFRTATHRIYGEPVRDWDGRWSLVLLPRLNAVTRDLVRKECAWLGFAALSTNVLAYPGADVDDLAATLERAGVAGDVVVMNATTVANEDAMCELARSGWNLDDIDQRYARFIGRFERARAAIEHARDVEHETAFRIRTLLIQEYRKVLLRDPKLPRRLLSADWHGESAYELCRSLYRTLYRGADAYLAGSLETVDGPMPDPELAYYRRFGGLDDDG